MKLFIIIWACLNSCWAQTYSQELTKGSADQGSARNFTMPDRDGPIGVGSEITICGVTYSYIRFSNDDYRISKKIGSQFINFIEIIPGQSSMETKFLHVYEDSEIVNIYTWEREGYGFRFYDKQQGFQPELTRFGIIPNSNHSMIANDPSIKSIDFLGSSELKITKDRSSQYPETELNFEFRSDGVYRNGKFDPSVVIFDTESTVERKLKENPEHYLKQQQRRVTQLEVIDREQNKPAAAMAERQSPQINNKIQQSASNPEPALAVPTSPELPLSPTKIEKDQNNTSWFACLVAAVALLLGYLWVQYFKRSA